MDQMIIDKAVAFATRQALLGRPLARLLWIPPQMATDDPIGSFALYVAENLSAADTPPWEKA